VFVSCVSSSMRCFLSSSGERSPTSSMVSLVLPKRAIEKHFGPSFAKLHPVGKWLIYQL
jgi:hypothetical protein